MKKLKIRPYARLLTMLGEQLIKNERIALMELIKNSYDADASWVKLSFVGFGPHYEVQDTSRILIEDDGHGMDEDVIVNHWLNPATPVKKNRKTERSEKGRVIQGEKGIGRFAILKLGRVINITTRTIADKNEHNVTYDFSGYDDDFRDETRKGENLFLDNIDVFLESSKPKKIIERKVQLGVRSVGVRPAGTLIEITKLKGAWNEAKVKDISRDVLKLQSIFSNRKSGKQADFTVYVDKDGDSTNFSTEYEERFRDLLESRSVLRIKKGHYNEKKATFKYEMEGAKKGRYEISTSDPKIKGLRIFKEHFTNDRIDQGKLRTQCGSFDFSFYIFDFSNKAPPRYELQKPDKDLIRPHRIYLYRDKIRVYPYGEIEDDWLHIDQYRGTVSAGAFLSNDQVVGVVDITERKNPNLKDKTNREGLLDLGNSTSDFIGLLQTFLAFVRENPYRQYQLDLKDKKAQDVYKEDIVQKQLDFLRENLKSEKKAEKALAKVEQAYRTERSFLVSRAEKTEDLAGIGLSVEVASHDISAVFARAIETVDNLIRDTMHNDANIDLINKELSTLRGSLSFVQEQMKDIQLLFRSTKRRRKNILLKEVLEKVSHIYSHLMKSSKIDLEIEEIGSPLVVKTTDAVLLQVLINLFDNSTYWLEYSVKNQRTIRVTLDGEQGLMIFSDNGPGISKDDTPYIFEPFYSGKGEEGRGLGLYIARQLLERSDYSIDLAQIKSEKKLSGANFVVSFIPEDD